MEKLLESTYFDNVDSLRYFQESIRRKGIVEELENLGIKEGGIQYLFVAMNLNFSTNK